MCFCLALDGVCVLIVVLVNSVGQRRALYFIMLVVLFDFVSLDVVLLLFVCDLAVLACIDSFVLVGVCMICCLPGLVIWLA